MLLLTFYVTAMLMRSGKLKPLIKWAGGKEKELKYIIPNLPKGFKHYYEPFVGGGAVYTAIEAGGYFINDKSVELIDFYKRIVSSDRELFFSTLEEMNYGWRMVTTFVKDNASFFLDTYHAFLQSRAMDDRLAVIVDTFVVKHAERLYDVCPDTLRFDKNNFLVVTKVNLLRKIKRVREIELKRHRLSDKDVLDNIETALKSAFYMQIRYLYNRREDLGLLPSRKAAIFFFIRNFAYSGMFRYNTSGYFNVPYGGMAYNNKNFLKKVDYLKTPALGSRLSKTVIESLDFEDFLQRYAPTEDDFLFVDPPYDSEFSTYAQNKFTKSDQVRLASYLIERCKAKWMMIIKNTDFVYRLYVQQGLQIKSFGKEYLVSFMNRNDKRAKHLLITNY